MSKLKAIWMTYMNNFSGGKTRIFQTQSKRSSTFEDIAKKSFFDKFNDFSNSLDSFCLNKKITSNQKCFLIQSE
jgi:hypothetical protein